MRAKIYNTLPPVEKAQCGAAQHSRVLVLSTQQLQNMPSNTSTDRRAVAPNGPTAPVNGYSPTLDLEQQAGGSNLQLLEKVFSTFTLGDLTSKRGAELVMSATAALAMPQSNFSQLSKLYE